MPCAWRRCSCWAPDSGPLRRYGSGGGQPDSTGQSVAASAATLERLSGDLRASEARLQSATSELAAARRREQEDAARYEALRRRADQLRVGHTAAQHASAQAAQETGRLQAHATSTDAALATSQAQIRELQPLAEEARAAQERARAAEATLAEARAAVQQLTGEAQAANDALERQRQLMALGRDVTDLMGARNLHIVDVVDTDPEGRDRKAFGRVFFTENKSLVFYAYDLNEARVQKANYEYRVWATKEAEPQRATSLGIFFSDNAAQRRWVFKCTDPKVLGEIDSVFVTLEPKNSKRPLPNGAKLLYAYLRGQPNHQ